MDVQSTDFSRESAQQKTFITQVYAWMCFALAITALVAWFIASTPGLVMAIFSSMWIFFGLLIAELILVGVLVKAIHKMSAQVATFVFFGYSFLNGLTFSLIFLAYTASSISSTFLVTACTFGIMSVYGFVTKRDLTSIGNLCGMALIGLVIASIVNLFFHNDVFYWITTYAGILIFVGLTAYDTQKIKRIHAGEFAGEEQERKSAILGALALYLDFVNLFLFLLRLFGRRR
jgi:Integral membrane protein, interacts with FtsH